MLADLSLRDLLLAAGSREPTPGGGSVAGCLAALGASMAEMAGRFSEGREGSEAVPGLVAELSALRERALALVDADSEGFAAVSAAYGLSRDSDEQKAARKAAIGEALRLAMAAPRELLDLSLAGLRLASELEPLCNPNLLSDVGVAAHALGGAARAAWLNVAVNLKGLPEGDEREAAREQGRDLVRQADALERALGGAVAARVGG